MIRKMTKADLPFPIKKVRTKKRSAPTTPTTVEERATRPLTLPPLPPKGVQSKAPSPTPTPRPEGNTTLGPARAPDFLVYVQERVGSRYVGHKTKVGAAWNNSTSGVSIRIDPGITVHVNRRFQLVLWPYSYAAAQSRSNPPVVGSGPISKEQQSYGDFGGDEPDDVPFG